MLAPAKINLTLHVTGRREDGYHLLDSLVVFADVGDRVGVSASDKLRLSVDGPMAAGVPTDDSNLVLQAARFLDAEKTAHIRLRKNLPTASGIGGGSSDAAATLRALSAFWSVDLPKDVSPLGADVPVCINPVPQRMRGVGDHLALLQHLPDTWLVLVNPGVEITTPTVFKALRKKENLPMPELIPEFSTVGDFAGWLANQRNDLQVPAIEIAPAIGTVLHALDTALLARMSGSGATCFGIYATAAEAQKIANDIAENHPDWWVTACRMLPG
ncbi:MAG: 4-(cytidine 5'-diphospho)-2-C-methyl-D-erythritol kinase [Sulfitobacter sp.]